MLKVNSDFPNYPKLGSYLDSATMGLQPEVSIQAQFEYIRDQPYTVRKSLHSRARVAEKIYYKSKERIAQQFGTKEYEIGVITNADITINQFILSFINQAKSSKPRFFTTIFEHHSIIAPLLTLKKQNKIELSILDTNEEPCMVEYIETNLEEGDIVCIGHTTQVIGLYRNIQELAKSVQIKGGYLIVDFSRTAGQYNLNFGDLQVDVAIVDGSIDLLGPSMSGFVYVRDQIIKDLDNPFPSSGNVGRVTSDIVNQIDGIEKFELGAPNISGLKGLTTSIDYLENLGNSSIINHRRQIIKYLINKLDEFKGISLIDPFLDHMSDNIQRSSIVSLKTDFHSHDIALLLDESYNVQIRSGLLCAHPGITELGLEEVMQISTHVYTTKDDIDLLIKALHGVISIFT